MAANPSNLTLLADGNGFHLYHYDAGADSLATVMAAGYFNNASHDLNLGADDQIIVKAADGFEILRVDAVTSGSVATEIGAGGSQWVGTVFQDIGSAASQYVVAPFDGRIRRVKAVLFGAIDADTALGLELGGTDVTGGQLTLVASGSAAGDVFETTATAANAVTEGQAVEIDTDGANSDADDVYVMVEFVPA